MSRTARGWRRPLLCVLVVIGLLLTHPVYRDLFLGKRDRWQTLSYSTYFGNLEVDRRAVTDFTWGKWFWNPDTGWGVPRLSDLGNRPLYPVTLIPLRFLSAATVWHLTNVVHVLLPVVGLVLLGTALGWPAWIVVLATAGSMVISNGLTKFSDVVVLGTGAWFPLRAWVALRALRDDAWTWWDSLWVVLGALMVAGMHPQYGFYYELLLAAFTVSLDRRAAWRQRWKLAARYGLYVGAVLPWLFAAASLYWETVRPHLPAFTDFDLAQAYRWSFGRAKARDFRAWIFDPYLVWAVLIPSVLLSLRSLGPIGRAWLGYFVFGLFHSIKPLYTPLVWLLGRPLLAFHYAARVFEPITWLCLLPLAELAAGATGSTRRRLLAGAFVVGVAGAYFMPALDPARFYVFPPPTRELPWELADVIHRAPRAYVFVGTESSRKVRDDVLLTNNHFFLGIPAVHVMSDMPDIRWTRAFYRSPGLLHMAGRHHVSAASVAPLVDLLGELGVGWVLWDGDAPPAGPRLREVARTRGFVLVEITGSRPLVYTLPALRAVERPVSHDRVPDLMRTIPAEGSFCYDCRDVGTGGPARLDAVEWRPGDIRVRVASASGTWVVLNETFHSGWRLEIDGREGRLRQVDEFVQGVWVEPGAHELRWRFRTVAFFWGLLGTGVALLAVGVLPVAARRRAPASPP